jgi:hypothetical protein
MTTGVAGGMIKPYKGSVLAMRLKTHRVVRQPLNLLRAAPQGAVLTLSPLGTISCLLLPAHP